MKYVYQPHNKFYWQKKLFISNLILNKQKFLIHSLKFVFVTQLKKNCASNILYFEKHADQTAANEKRPASLQLYILLHLPENINFFILIFSGKLHFRFQPLLVKFCFENSTVGTQNSEMKPRSALLFLGLILALVNSKFLKIDVLNRKLSVYHFE